MAPMASLLERNVTATFTNSSSAALQVVCAWPVSGQYGPGSRVLYYVLVAACVFARKAEWLRNACLAAALLFPAVAALHGLVLAALHVNGAVDMDIYGAFQLCSIGILAAPLTVRISRTYFYDPGRNLIFLWTGLILAGLLALTVELYRVTPASCTHDDVGQPISFNAKEFPYGNATCGLVCSASGPHSPLRGGSTNEIFVIPVPHKLSFNTAMLLAAACCVPAILSLVFMWIKILEINWKSRFEDEEVDREIEGTNGATTGKMRIVNNMVRLFLSVIEVPVFGAAVLAILGIGESNFFSPQVRYQTEPIASIGQWAPIAGTVLAALGSLYLLLTANPSTVVSDDPPKSPMHHCNCSHHQNDSEGLPMAQLHSSIHHSQIRIHDDASDRLSNEVHTAQTATSRPSLSPSPDGHPQSANVDAGRRRMAKFLTATGNYLGSAAHKKFTDAEFKHGRAVDFPEIPGERNRNPDLTRIKSQYRERVSRDRGNQPSRVGSSASSFVSVVGPEGSSSAARDHSPLSSPRTVSPGRMTRIRRDTLTVPSPALR